MLADVLHFAAMEEGPNRIRELRVEAGLSQQALGDAIGSSKMTISDLERGQMQLTLEYMRRIADALGVLPADLLARDDNPDALSLEERHLIEQLRAGTAEQREQLRKVADVLLPCAHETAEDSHPLRPRRRAG